MAANEPKPEAAAFIKDDNIHFTTDGTPAEFSICRALPGEDLSLFDYPKASEVAASAFHRLHGELNVLGLVTTLDVEMLKAYCQAYGMWVEATALVNKMGMVQKTSNNNYIQNPYVAIVNKQAALMTKIGSEFGMSPSSRASLDVKPATQGIGDPVDELLQRRLKA